MRIVLLLTAALLPPAQVFAHDEGIHAAASPSSWDIGILAALMAAGVLYAIGIRKLSGRGARVRRIEQVSFWAGWTAIVAAVAPPLDRAAALSFSSHMAQHELLILVGAPLLIVGRPIVPWLWALPNRVRPAAARGLQLHHVGRAWSALTSPAVAWALHGAVVWLWHAPVMYEAAVRSEGIHAVQHATFVATAVLFWWGLVYGRYGRAAYGASTLFVFVTMMHTGVLGALFALSTSPYYGVYAERAAAAGVDAVEDQQLAGLYMWVPSGIVLTLFGLALLLAWLSESDRRAGVRRTMAMLLPAFVLSSAVFASSGCSGIPHESEAQRLTGGSPSRGRERIRHYGCDTCHTIPGVPTADATVGPPLVKVARRLYLAGHIENSPENMMRWIQHPRVHDPLTAMPEMGVTPADSRDITAYLYTLR